MCTGICSTCCIELECDSNSFDADHDPTNGCELDVDVTDSDESKRSVLIPFGVFAFLCLVALARHCAKERRYHKQDAASAVDPEPLPGTELDEMESKGEVEPLIKAAFGE